MFFFHLSFFSKSPSAHTQLQTLGVTLNLHTPQTIMCRVRSSCCSSNVFTFFHSMQDVSLFSADVPVGKILDAQTCCSYINTLVNVSKLTLFQMLSCENYCLLNENTLDLNNSLQKLCFNGSNCLSPNDLNIVCSYQM